MQIKLDKKSITEKFSNIKKKIPHKKIDKMLNSQTANTTKTILGTAGAAKSLEEFVTDQN